MLPEPPGGYLEEGAAKDAMLAFVNAGDFDMPVALPKRVQAEHAAQFVELHLQLDELIDRQVDRAGQIMRFYDLRKQVPALTTTLNRPVNDRADWDVAATTLAILGDLGGPDYSAACLRYYAGLLTHADAIVKRSIDLFFHLPVQADAAPVEQMLNTRIDALSKRVAAQEDDALVEHYHLEDLRDDRLPSIRKAKEQGHQIMASDDTNRRRQHIALRYLKLDRSAYLDLPMWGAMLMQRECNSSEPNEIAAFFGHSLDIISSRADKLGPLSEDGEMTLGNYVTRCVRAIDFYGGSLTERQSEFAEERIKPHQIDLLHWDHVA